MDINTKKEKRRLSEERTNRDLRILRIVGMGLVVALLISGVMVLLTAGRAAAQQAGPAKRLQVVTSLFPLYDFARQIGLDRADVSLLLPPGVEPHGFEPRPRDMIRLNRSDVFIYTNRAMEPWAVDLLKGVRNKKLKAVEAGRGIALSAIPEAQGADKKGTSVRHGHDHKAAHGYGSGRHHDHSHGGGDPHIWLDFDNAARMTDQILAGFIEKDSVNGDFYRENAKACKTKLKDLDRRFKEGLSGCRKNVIVQGGHFAFGYLANRYGFKYVAVSGVSPNAEPTPAAMATLTQTLRDNGLDHLFYEELLSPRVAQAIARETGASLLMLSPAANVSKTDFDRGIGFIDLMQRNLKHLQVGLQCPKP
jgi:zinc transport system substrate-binding protein